MQSQILSDKQKAFLSILSEQEKDQGLGLLSFLNEKDEKYLKGFLNPYLEKSPGGGRQDFNQLVAKGNQQDLSQLFEKVNTGWLVEALKEEAPLILALLLKTLPSQKVGRILSEFSREVRKSVKKFEHLNPLPDFQNYLIRLFLSKVPFGSATHEFPEELKGLNRLSGEQFLNFFREIGLNEVSLALSNLHKGATRAILHRMDVQDAKELKKRIRKEGEQSVTILREAQINLLELDLEKIKKEELALEVGLSVFAQIFLQEEFPAAFDFVYRLPPHFGYLLKRYLEQTHTPRIPQKVRRTRDRVLEVLGPVPG